MHNRRGAYTDWVPTAWAQTNGMDRFFKLENGTVTVKEAGLYQIYAQVCLLRKKI